MNILRNKKIQKSLISECYDPGMTKVFKKDPKILDFQSCGSVNNLENEKIQKSLILPIVIIWVKQKKNLNPKILDLFSVIIWKRQKSRQNNPKFLEFQWCGSINV